MPVQSNWNDETKGLILTDSRRNEIKHVPSALRHWVFVELQIPTPLPGSFSVIAKEFPDRVATMFACLETFFGLGLIVGPSVGGALYEAGG